MKGTHIAFAGGTGVFPFLDLVALIIRYVCYKAKHIKICKEEKFDKIDENFRFILFASFTDLKGCIFKEECEMLQEICRLYNIHTFAFHSRISTIDKTKWDKTFMSRNLRNVGNLEKIHIVGPVTFMDSIKDALKMCDVDVEEKLNFP